MYLIHTFFFLEIFRKVLITTIVSWAEETQIETPKLVREMFRYIYILIIIIIINSKIKSGMVAQMKLELPPTHFFLTRFLKLLPI